MFHVISPKESHGRARDAHKMTSEFFARALFRFPVCRLLYLQPHMLINPEALTHWIDNFYGYGSWEASIWFVSHEESGGELPEEVADRINYLSAQLARKSEPTRCDIRDLYRHVRFHADGPRADLFKMRYDYRFGQEAVLHGLWKNLIAFAHGYHRHKLPDLLAYQKDFFLSPTTHKEALIPFYPLPAQNNHAWYYSWLDLPQMPWLRSRVTYQEQVYATRVKSILQHMDQYAPEVVLMYGMENINRLKDSVCALFPSAKFTMVRAMPQKIPQHHHAKINSTTLLITTQMPALHHRRVETGFDWFAFGEKVRVGESEKSRRKT